MPGRARGAGGGGSAVLAGQLADAGRVSSPTLNYLRRAGSRVTQLAARAAGRGHRGGPAGGHGRAAAEAAGEACTRVCASVQTGAMLEGGAGWAPTPRPRLWVQEGFSCPRSRGKTWPSRRGVPSAAPAPPPRLGMGGRTLPSPRFGPGVLLAPLPARAAPSPLPAPGAITKPARGVRRQSVGMEPRSISAHARAPRPPFPAHPRDHPLPRHAGTVPLTLALRDKVTGAAACRERARHCPAAERSPRPPGKEVFGGGGDAACHGRPRPGGTQSGSPSRRQESRSAARRAAGPACPALLWGPQPSRGHGDITCPWGHTGGTPNPAWGPQPKAPILHPLPSSVLGGTEPVWGGMGLSQGAKWTFLGGCMARR